MTSYLLLALIYVIFVSFKLIYDFCFGNFLLHTQCVSLKEPFLLYKCSFKGINQARCFSVFIVELSMFLTTG